MAMAALVYAVLPACGQQDDTQRIVAQCSNPPPDRIDSCLEQARVQEETDPSPEMQKLVATLIKLQVEARNAPRDLESPPPPDADSGSHEASPASAPQEIAPPAMQDNSAARDDLDEDSPPAMTNGDPKNPSQDNGGGPEGA
jgi:hypothetical protein